MIMFNQNLYLSTLLYDVPTAYAYIYGSIKYPTIYGNLMLYEVPGGTLALAQVMGLPVSDTPCSSNIHGFHIHGGSVCNGSAANPFSDADGHFNPGNCPHPSHAGDLPPLFANQGFAWSSFFTDRFTAREVVGKVAIIHANPDDFTTQPSGNSGEMIACGEIKSHLTSS